MLQQLVRRLQAVLAALVGLVSPAASPLAAQPRERPRGGVSRRQPEYEPYAVANTLTRLKWLAEGRHMPTRTSDQASALVPDEVGFGDVHAYMQDFSQFVRLIQAEAGGPVVAAAGRDTSARMPG